MIIPETAVTLKDGTKVILRSPQPRDAAQLNEYLRLTSGETHYMVRYPEECDRTLEAAQKRLRAVTDHERSFMLAAFLDGELVGNCGVNAMSDHFKMRHRASLGISIEKKAWGLGLGTLLMEKALEQAKENGFTQVELGASVPEARLYRDGLHSEGVLSQGRHIPRRGADGEVPDGLRISAPHPTVLREAPSEHRKRASRMACSFSCLVIRLHAQPCSSGGILCRRKHGAEYRQRSP